MRGAPPEKMTGERRTRKTARNMKVRRQSAQAAIRYKDRARGELPCKRKRLHVSRARANGVLARIHEKFGRSETLTLSVYHCRFCGFYHLGNAVEILYAEKREGSHDASSS